VHFIQLCDLVEQLARLLRIGDPGCGTRQPSLEVVRPSAQELVAHMQRFASFNSSKDALTSQNTP
jgi:hypothetical protein